MNNPEIKILSVSNVFCRLMHFKHKGDVEEGHCHTFDHGTLVSSGKVLVELLNDDKTVEASREYNAPHFIFIDKDRLHKITALEDNTVAVCIHALRDITGELLDPSFFVDQKIFADGAKDRRPNHPVIQEVVSILPFTVDKTKDVI